MGILNKLFGKKSEYDTFCESKKEQYMHKPAECEYYILCESQCGTQQCSMKRADCLKCNRRLSYVNENAGTDIETSRIKMYTVEGQKALYGMK